MSRRGSLLRGFLLLVCHDWIRAHLQDNYGNNDAETASRRNYIADMRTWRETIHTFQELPWSSNLICVFSMILSRMNIIELDMWLCYTCNTLIFPSKQIMQIEIETNKHVIWKNRSLSSLYELCFHVLKWLLMRTKSVFLSEALKEKKKHFLIFEEVSLLRYLSQWGSCQFFTLTDRQSDARTHARTHAHTHTQKQRNKHTHATPLTIHHNSPYVVILFIYNYIFTSFKN